MVSTALFAVVARCFCGIAFEGRFTCLGAHTIFARELEKMEMEIDKVFGEMQGPA